MWETAEVAADSTLEAVEATAEVAAEETARRIDDS
jgi:hypothetical protein